MRRPGMTRALVPRLAWTHVAKQHEARTALAAAACATATSAADHAGDSIPSTLFRRVNCAWIQGSHEHLKQHPRVMPTAAHMNCDISIWLNSRLLLLRCLCYEPFLPRAACILEPHLQTAEMDWKSRFLPHRPPPRPPHAGVGGSGASP